MKSCKKAVNWLIFSHFIIDCYPGFIAPLLPFIASKVGITMKDAMAIISIANISSYLLQPIFGYFSDKCRKRFFVFWGIIIASVFLPMMGLAESFLALTFAIVLGEIGVGFFHPQATSFVPKFCKNTEESTWNTGIFLSMGSIGYGVGALAATNIYEFFGKQAIMYTSIVGVLTALAMFGCVPKVSCDEEDEHKERISLMTSMRAIFSLRLERILIAASIAKSIVVSSYTLIMPFFWKNIGLSASKIGWINCAFLATSTLGMIAAPKFEQKIGSRNTFYFSFLLTLPLSLAMVFFMKINLIVAIILYSIIGFVIFLTQPINVVMSQKLLPKYKSTISGVVGGFTWGIVGVLLPVLSFGMEKIGILNGMLFVTAIPLVMCIWVREIPEKPLD